MTAKPTYRNGRRADVNCVIYGTSPIEPQGKPTRLDSKSPNTNRDEIVLEMAAFARALADRKARGWRCSY